MYFWIEDWRYFMLEDGADSADNFASELSGFLYETF